MKKIVSMMSAITLSIFTLTGCSSENTQTENTQTNDDKIKVISTVFPGYDFTKEIGKDLVDASILIPPGAESHSYEPSPQDIIDIQNADLFIYTGGESDEWIDEILESMDKPVKTLKMVDCVELLENEEHTHEDEHSHDEEHTEEHSEENHSEEEHTEEEHEHSEYDEHVWTSPKNAIKISEKIEEALSDIDEENSSTYQKNLDEYILELEKLDNEFTEFFKTVDNKTLIFGDRFPFRYFANEYGLDYHAAYMGCSTDVEPSASTIAELIDIVNDEKIGTIFYIEFSNHKVADSIAESTGADTKMLHSCHNVSKDELNNNATYISLMKNNLETLKEAMK